MVNRGLLVGSRSGWDLFVPQEVKWREGLVGVTVPMGMGYVHLPWLIFHLCIEMEFIQGFHWLEIFQLHFSISIPYTT